MEGHSTERGLPYFRKARSPQEERVMGSRSKWLSVADLRARDGRNSSRSSEIQLGESPSWVLYTRQSTLYSTLQCTGSQWRSLRTGVMWSITLMGLTTSAAMFWTYCSLVTASSAIPVSRALLMSSRDVKKAWTILSQEFLSRNFLILPMFLIWYSADWHTVFTLGDHGNVGVKHCPKVPHWCDWSNEGVANHHTRQRDLLQLLT